jgi:hypothetical protein
MALLPLAGSLSALKLSPLKLEGSQWRVPLEWGAWGRTPHSLAFGFALGTGVLTKLSSPGLFAVFAWTVVAHSLIEAWLPFLAFAVGRAISYFVVARQILVQTTPRYEPLIHGVAKVRRLLVPEAFLLAGMSSILLLSNQL